MKAFKDFDKVQAAGTPRAKLPAGGYVGKVIGAKVVEYNGRNGVFERLEIALDITEGEYAGYYKNDFDNNTNEDRKWRGVCRLYVPTDDGSDKDEITKRIFKGMVVAFEESNSSFHWDWDESKLKGLTVGMLVRDKEYDIEGRRGFAPEIFKLVDVDYIRKGKFEIPATKLLNGSTAPAGSTSSAAQTAETDDDYPF